MTSSVSFRWLGRGSTTINWALIRTRYLQAVDSVCGVCSTRNPSHFVQAILYTCGFSENLQSICLVVSDCQNKMALIIGEIIRAVRLHYAKRNLFLNEKGSINPDQRYIKWRDS